MHIQYTLIYSPNIEKYLTFMLAQTIYWTFRMTKKQYLKSIFALWHIHASDISNVQKLSVVSILEEGDHRDDAVRVDQDLEFVPRCHLYLLDVLRQTLRNKRAEVK